MDGFRQLRTWLQDRAPRGVGGFSLVELLVSVGILGVLAGITTVAFGGFDSASSSMSCRSDRTRLQRAESSFFLQKARYGSEAELVSAGLIGSSSDIHDVTVASSAYSISEVGRCIGTSTAYNIAAPTVGTTTNSGVTVAVMNANGSGASGAVVSYSQGSWTTMGTTTSTGQVNAALSDGTYDFRVVLGGTTNTLSGVTVKQGTLVTFPTVALTVTLANGAGTPVSGGAISVKSSGGSSSSQGTTGASGTITTQVLPAIYDVTMTLASRSMTQTSIVVNAPTAVPFTTHTLTVKLLAAGGGGLSGGSVTATPTGNSAFSLGSTNSSGIVTATVLDGPYTIAMSYSGMSSSQTPTLSADTTVTFQIGTVTLKMLASTGSGLSGADSAIWWRPAGTSSWTFAGYPNSSGVVTVSMLPGNYDFEARWVSVYEVKSAVAVSGGSIVTWQAVAATEFMRASTGSGLSGQDSAIWVRPAGSSSWTFSGYPNSAGQVVQELLVASYDFQARWFGQYEVKSAVSIAAATTVTWQAVAATEFMRASTGSGLSGQDAAIWVRPAGTSSWYFSGYPNGSGQVVQEVWVATYDFQARWFGQYEVQSNVAIAAATTVTFQGQAVTLSLLASTGSGLSGQDSAIWVRPTGTSSWFFSGYPNASGNVAQELLVASYDAQFRWLGVYQVSSSNSVSGATTIAANAAALTVTARKASDNSLVVGANTSVITAGGTYYLGDTNGSGQYVAQVLVGTVGARCTKSPITGTNSNVVVPSGGASTTVLLS